MVELQWKVEGRRFRSQEEYMAALRDKQLIDSITANLKLNKPQDIEKLYLELKRGKYQFESIVGRQFDDNVYELYMQIKEEEAQKQEQKALQKEKKRQERERRKESIKAIGKPKKTAKGERVRLEDFDKDMQKEILQELRRKEKRKKLIIAMCIPICALCFGYFVLYYQEASRSNAQVADLIALKESATEYNSSYMNGNEVVIHRTDSSTDAPEILSEYKTLHNKNQKLIGWIKIDDTIIDYPVMQTVNNEYYLNHNFNQEEDRNGCIFMDYQCDVVKGCDNMILYGHHMQSGKMFGSLNKYSSESYYKEHPKIQFDTIYEKGQYEIMYVFRSKVYSEEEVTFKYYQFINAGSEQEFNSYMNEMAALSIYDTGVTATYGDKLLTLSTCDYQENDGRFVVVAKRVNE